MYDDSTAAARISQELRKEIAPLPPGAKLPSQRELVRRYGVSASTVAQAVALLAQQHVIESRPGAGSFKAHTRMKEAQIDSGWQHSALNPPPQEDGGSLPIRSLGVRGLQDTLTQFSANVIDLNGGYLHPDLRPTSQLSSALTRVSKRSDAWNKPPAEGAPELRDWFAKDISPSLARRDILIAPGGQAALATTMRALAHPGSHVVVESPTYPGTLAAALSAGVRCTAIAVDDEGICTNELANILKRTQVSAIVLQPLHQNPTGVTMSPARREAVLELARNHGTFIIEDDFARYLSHADAITPPAPLIDQDRHGNVVHIRSLTKPTSPNLRVAAIASRGPVTDRLRDALTTDSLMVPAVLQHTAFEVIASTAWKRGQKQLALELQRRRNVAMSEVTQRLGHGAVYGHPRGGYHLWVRTPDDRSSEQFSREALASGVAITPGSNYYLDGHPDPALFRLSYVAVPTLNELEIGIRSLVD